MTYEEIIQELRQCAKSDCSSCGMCPIFPDRECVEHLATAAASLIERLAAENVALREKVPQWISVEEKLPADYIKRYLIAFKDAGGSIVDAARYIPGLGWECRNWEVPQGLITDWMPLPGAPEKGDKA